MVGLLPRTSMCFPATTHGLKIHVPPHSQKEDNDNFRAFS